PDLLAVYDVFVAVALGMGRERREVAAGSGLAEQLAPELRAGEDPGEVAVLLLLGAGDQERRAGPADADRVEGAGRPGGAELLVDDQLLHGAGVASIRLGPVGGDVSGLRQPHGPVGRETSARGVLADERPDLVPVHLRLCRQVEVHWRRLPTISLPAAGGC